MRELWFTFQDQAVAFEELKKTMETTRAHLQNQLRTKEMDSNRLSVQIRVGIVELANENSLFAKRKSEKGLEEFFLGSTVGTVVRDSTHLTPVRSKPAGKFFCCTARSQKLGTC